MPVYKDKKKGSWYLVIRYTDFTGTHKQTTKRGFKAKTEAKYYERRFHLKIEGDLTMYFDDFYEIYISAMENRLRTSILLGKENMFETKIC